MKARIIGVNTMMSKFNFLFGCTIGKTLLNQTDNLSEKLQSSKLSALEAQNIAKDSVKALRMDRNEDTFNHFGSTLSSCKTNYLLKIQLHFVKEKYRHVTMNLQIPLTSHRRQKTNTELFISNV